MKLLDCETRVSLKNILFATDFSKQSDAALSYALSIARRYGSTVFAAHVIPDRPLLASPPIEAWEAMTAQAAPEAKESLALLESQLKGIPHEMLLRKGSVWPELSEIIDAKAIDLLVLGTHGRTGASKVLMGSVAERIFRQAQCPVLTVGPQVAGEPASIADMHEILLPTDFSRESLAAVPYAVSLAQEHRARLHLLHVAENLLTASAEAWMIERLQSLVPPEAELWCEPKVLVEYGSAAEKILECAEELGTDVIILGVKRTSSHLGATHVSLATAYNVVSQAICPVLTVRG